MTESMRPSRPSDLPAFAMLIYSNSATEMQFDDYFFMYEELFKILMFNPDVDLPLAIERQQRERLIGTVR